MREGRDLTRRLHSESYRNLVTESLIKLAAHFRVEIFDKEIEIFIEKLPSWSNYQIAEAFAACMTECLFFPKLKEVIDRMPEDRGPRIIKTCQACEPDGWRFVPNADATGYQVTRCDHKPEYKRNPLPAEQLRKPYENPEDWVKLASTPGLHKTERPPRFPHLIGKGIKYGNVSTKLPGKPDEPTQK